MSQGEPRDPGKKPPYAVDESLVINTRLNEIERQQREEKAEERQYKSRQLITNRLVAIFTGLLFFTSVVSDVILIRQTAINYNDGYQDVPAIPVCQAWLTADVPHPEQPSPARWTVNQFYGCVEFRKTLEMVARQKAKDR